MDERVFETRLEMLLISKDFKDLTADEKKYVHNFLSEEEYCAYSFLISRYKPALLSDYDKLQPSPKITGALAQAFNTQTASSKRLYFFERPFYQSMAAAIMIILAGYIYFSVHVDKKKQLLKANTVAANKSQRKEVLPPTTNDRKLTETLLTLNAKPVKIHHNKMTRRDYRNLCINISNASINPSINTQPIIPCLNPIYTMVKDTMVTLY